MARPLLALAGALLQLAAAVRQSVSVRDLALERADSQPGKAAGLPEGMADKFGDLKDTAHELKKAAETLQGAINAYRRDNVLFVDFGASLQSSMPKLQTGYQELIRDKVCKGKAENCAARVQGGIIMSALSEARKSTDLPMVRLVASIDEVLEAKCKFKLQYASQSRISVCAENASKGYVFWTKEVPEKPLLPKEVEDTFLVFQAALSEELAKDKPFGIEVGTGMLSVQWPGSMGLLSVLPPHQLLGLGGLRGGSSKVQSITMKPVPTKYHQLLGAVTRTRSVLKVLDSKPTVNDIKKLGELLDKHKDIISSEITTLQGKVTAQIELLEQKKAQQEEARRTAMQAVEAAKSQMAELTANLEEATEESFTMFSRIDDSEDDPHTVAKDITGPANFRAEADRVTSVFQGAVDKLKENLAASQLKRDAVVAESVDVEKKQLAAEAAEKEVAIAEEELQKRKAAVAVVEKDQIVHGEWLEVWRTLVEDPKLLTMQVTDEVIWALQVQGCPADSYIKDSDSKPRTPNEVLADGFVQCDKCENQRTAIVKRDVGVADMSYYRWGLSKVKEMLWGRKSEADMAEAAEYMSPPGSRDLAQCGAYLCCCVGEECGLEGKAQWGPSLTCAVRHEDESLDKVEKGKGAWDYQEKCKKPQLWRTEA